MDFGVPIRLLSVIGCVCFWLARAQATGPEQAATRPAAPIDVSGIYRQGKYNELRIVSIDPKTLDVHYCGTYPTANGQGLNFGDARGHAALEGNVARLRPPDTDSCVITIEFVRDGAKVTQTGSSAECALGHNVEATGTYRRVKSGKVPLLDELFCAG